MSRTSSRTEPFADRFKNRFFNAGVMAWALGYAATWSFLTALGVPDPFNYIVAFCIQYLLTNLEGPFVVGDRDAWGFGAFLVDTLLNAAGMFVFIMNVDKTQLWKMAQFLTSSDQGAGPYVIGIICLGLGALVAAAPEILFAKARRYKHGLHSNIRVVAQTREIDETGREVSRERERGREQPARGQRRDQGRREQPRRGERTGGLAALAKRARQMTGREDPDEDPIEDEPRGRGRSADDQQTAAERARQRREGSRANRRPGRERDPEGEVAEVLDAPPEEFIEEEYSAR